MKLINCDNQDIVYYQIKKGDNINTIIKKFNIQNNSIIRNNPSIDLYEGEIIKIRRKANILHIVKPMDSLEKIATKYSTSVDELIKLNNLNSTRLFVGQVIIISQNT